MKVNRRNKLTEDAQRAYLNGNFFEASQQYKLLSTQSFFTPPEVTLNLANALFESNDIISARDKYAQLASLKDPLLASITYTQLGIIFCSQTDTAKALLLFKEALMFKPDNEIARYNYELLKRQFNPKNPRNITSQQPKQRQNLPQQKQEEPKETDENNAQKQLLKTLKNYGLTPEKAKIILDGMKNNEIHYIQQKQISYKNNDAHITKNW